MNRRAFLVASSSFILPLTAIPGAQANPVLVRIGLWFLGTVAAYYVNKTIEEWEGKGHEAVKKESISRVSVTSSIDYISSDSGNLLYPSGFTRVNVTNLETGGVFTTEAKKFTLAWGVRSEQSFYIQNLIQRGPLVVDATCSSQDRGVDFIMDSSSSKKFYAI